MKVVDTNVLSYFLIPGEHTAAAQAAFRQDPEWIAPPLWRSEFRNVLGLYLRRGEISRGEALELYEKAERLLPEEHAVETEAVLRLVESSHCSAYDCEFVALAQASGSTLLTSDRELLRKFPDVTTAPMA